MIEGRKGSPHPKKFNQLLGRTRSPSIQETWVRGANPWAQRVLPLTKMTPKEEGRQHGNEIAKKNQENATPHNGQPQKRKTAKQKHNQPGQQPRPGSVPGWVHSGPRLCVPVADFLCKTPLMCWARARPKSLDEDESPGSGENRKPTEEPVNHHA